MVKQDFILSLVNSIYAATIDGNAYSIFEHKWEKFLEEWEEEDGLPTDISGHLERALDIIHELSKAHNQSMNIQDYIANREEPCIAINRKGQALASNLLWQKLYGKNFWDIAKTPLDREKIENALKHIDNITHDKMVSRARDNSAYAYKIINLYHDAGEWQLLIIEMIPGHVNHDDALLVRMATTQWFTEIRQLLSENFDLSETEIILLREMTGLLSLNEIAEKQEKSTETIKSQAKSIYRKMMTSGREETVKILMQIMILISSRNQWAQHNSEALALSRDKIPRYHPLQNSCRHQQIILDNGMSLGVRCHGPKNGTPVIFLHGMVFGHYLHKKFIDEMASRNMLLIMISRPGYMGSSILPSNCDMIQLWTDIFPEILAKLGVKQPVYLMSHTTGIVYCALAASLYPDRVKGVFAMAAGIPIVDADKLKTLPRVLRIMAKTARLSPIALKFVMQSIAKYFFTSEANKKKVIVSVYGNNPSDQLALQRPDIMEIMYADMGVMSETDFSGYVADSQIVFFDWTHLIDSITCQLYFVTGSDDKICPLQWVQEFAQKNPRFFVREITHSGTLLHLSHIDDILLHWDDFFAKTNGI